MKTFRSFLVLLAGLAGFILPGRAADTTGAAPETISARTALELLRSDLKQEKAVVIAQNITFSDDESAEFWPLYNEYNAALNLLLDERVQLIKEYLAKHDTLTDAQATALAGQVFELETRRTELKRTWFKKFSEVVPAKKAAQFFQIENQINAALDLLLMDALPLIR